MASGSVVNLVPCQAGTSYSFEGNLDEYTGGTSADFKVGFTTPALTGVTSGAVYDAGTVSLTVNGTEIGSANYGQGVSELQLVSALAAACSGNSVVNVEGSDNNLVLSAKDGGTESDYSYVVNITYDSAVFSTPSFSPSSASGDLAGGENAPLYNWAINSYAPDGDVLSMNDSVMGTWSYTYDDHNRLVTGSATSGSMSGLSMDWTYDRYGNRWSQSATGTGKATVVQTSMSFSGNNNRIDQFSSNYDSDGNLKNDGLNAYTYDAENRISTVNGAATYIYDAEGMRVAKLGSGGAVSSVYILVAGGQQMTEINASGLWFPSVSLLDWKTGLPNARYRVLQLLHDNFGPSDVIVESSIRSLEIAACAYIAPNGGRKILLINKSNHQVELQLAGAEDSVEQHVDMDTGAREAVTSRLRTSTIYLGSLAVMVVKLHQS